MQLSDRELQEWNKYQADVNKLVGRYTELREQIKQKDEVIKEYQKLCSGYKEIIKDYKTSCDKQQNLIAEMLKKLIKEALEKSQELDASNFKQYFDEELSEKLEKILESEPTNE